MIDSMTKSLLNIIKTQEIVKNKCNKCKKLIINLFQFLRIKKVIKNSNNHSACVHIVKNLIKDFVVKIFQICIGFMHVLCLLFVLNVNKLFKFVFIQLIQSVNAKIVNILKNVQDVNNQSIKEIIKHMFKRNNVYQQSLQHLQIDVPYVIQIYPQVRTVGDSIQQNKDVKIIQENDFILLFCYFK